jgi:Spy/CpxP family protein refolding chaperone
MDNTMQKTRMLFALGTALMLAGPTVSAQGGQPPRGGEGRGERHGEFRRGGPGGGLRHLLKGITLTEDQKAKLKALHEQNKSQMDANREQFKKTMEEAKALREKGDTAGAHAKMRPLMEQRKADMEKHAAQLRAILTPEQQKQFDANLAEWKAKGDKPHGKEMRGKGEGRQHRRGA